jgi:hypothetical protein
MGMHWLGYDNGIVGKVAKNTFVVAEQLNYLVYIEMSTPKYRDFFVFTRKIHPVKHMPIELSLSQKYNTAKLVLVAFFTIKQFFTERCMMIMI